MGSLLTGPNALLLAPECMPFTVALGVMLAIGLLEGVGMIIGMGFGHLLDTMLPDFDLDLDVDADANVGSHGLLAHSLGWLNFGRVPAIIVFIVMLTSFGFAGLMVQEMARDLFGGFLHTALGAVAAFALSLPLTRVVTSGIARVMPQDETEAVGRHTFVGRDATLLQASASRGQPAQAKLRDAFGHTHYVMVEPDDGVETLSPQSQVRIVRQAGAFFVAVPQQD